MGTSSFYPGIGNLGFSKAFPFLFVIGNHNIFYTSGTGWETVSDNFWGEVPRLLRKWEVPVLGAYFYRLSLFPFIPLVLA